jgi:hypothetical protein
VSESQDGLAGGAGGPDRGGEGQDALPHEAALASSPQPRLESVI